MRPSFPPSARANASIRSSRPARSRRWTPPCPAWTCSVSRALSTYKSKLEAYKKNTTLKDAVVTGLCKIGEQRVALGVMDFNFLGGSMGSVVGEKTDTP